MQKIQKKNKLKIYIYICHIYDKNILYSSNLITALSVLFFQQIDFLVSVYSS